MREKKLQITLVFILLSLNLFPYAFSSSPGALAQKRGVNSLQLVYEQDCW